MTFHPRGFIALMSVLIICAVLLLIATGGSFAGFYGRQNSMAFEFKERSQALASACVSQTLLALANDSTYSGSATTTISGTNACYTGTVAKTGAAPNDTYSFRTRAYVGSAYTSFAVVANVSDLAVQSLTELPTF